MTLPIKLSNSTRLLCQEANRMGIETQVVLAPYLVKMTKNGVSFLTMASRTSVQSSVGKSIADDKLLTKEFLKVNNFPTAKFVNINSPEDLENLNQLNSPFVLKPALGSFGDNVFTNLSSMDEVSEIISKTKLEKGGWIAEEQLKGRDFRVTCIDYKMVAAAYRKPAFVKGDGKSNIRELIDTKNSQPERGDGHHDQLAIISIDEDSQKCLKEQHKTLDSVLKNTEEVYLKSVCNLSKGGETQDVTKEVCQENIDLFELISRSIDLNIIGIDVMADTLSKPLTQNSKSGIIEINASPGIFIHQADYKKDSINIARPILEMTLRKLGIS